jgi:hypothetical protein
MITPEIDPTLLAALFIAHFAVAAALVLVGYKLLEVSWGTGFIGTIILGISTLVAEWYIGHVLWAPRFNAIELIEVVLASLAGAVIAVAVIVTVFEPETGQDEGEDGTRAYVRTGSSIDDPSDIPGGLEDLED